MGLLEILWILKNIIFQFGLNILLQTQEIPHGHGEINCPIIISGQQILPGDWIVADDDGVMVLPKSEVVEMANRAANVLEAENRIRQEIRATNSSLSKVLNLLRWEKIG